MANSPKYMYVFLFLLVLGCLNVGFTATLVATALFFTTCPGASRVRVACPQFAYHNVITSDASSQVEQTIRVFGGVRRRQTLSLRRGPSQHTKYDHPGAKK